MISFFKRPDDKKFNVKIMRGYGLMNKDFNVIIIPMISVLRGLVTFLKFQCIIYYKKVLFSG
jgi:hypothetical protein